MSGWPTSLFDWDILFLLPLPWWGPVLAPMSHRFPDDRLGHLCHPVHRSSPARLLTPTLWGLNGLGIVLALYVFMADAIRTVPQGLDATKNMLPTAFNWAMFAWRSP